MGIVLKTQTAQEWQDSRGEELRSEGDRRQGDGEDEVEEEAEPLGSDEVEAVRAAEDLKEELATSVCGEQRRSAGLGHLLLLSPRSHPRLARLARRKPRRHLRPARRSPRRLRRRTLGALGVILEGRNGRIQTRGRGRTGLRPTTATTTAALMRALAVDRPLAAALAVASMLVASQTLASRGVDVALGVAALVVGVGVGVRLVQRLTRVAHRPEDGHAPFEETHLSR